MVHQYRIAAVIAVTAALAASLMLSASAAAAPLGPTEGGITVTHPAAAPGYNRWPDGKALAPDLVFKHGSGGQATTAAPGFNRASDGQASAATLGFNRASDGQATAAMLGFNRGPDGQATATELGFKHGSDGQATAAALGFNPGPVSQANTTASTAGSPSARASGFHWDDAGIGAAGALGLLMLLLGGALVMTKGRRRPRSHVAQPTT